MKPECFKKIGKKALKLHGSEIFKGNTKYHMQRTSKLQDWKLEYTIYENLKRKIRYKLYDKTGEK
jgi:hypothetical protein